MVRCLSVPGGGGDQHGPSKNATRENAQKNKKIGGCTQTPSGDPPGKQFSWKAHGKISTSRREIFHCARKKWGKSQKFGLRGKLGPKFGISLSKKIFQQKNWKILGGKTRQQKQKKSKFPNQTPKKKTAKKRVLASPSVYSLLTNTTQSHLGSVCNARSFLSKNIHSTINFHGQTRFQGKSINPAYKQVIKYFTHIWPEGLLLAV